MSDDTTHWDNCATEGGPAHYECAKARIVTLIRERDAALAHAQALWQQMRLINKATYICTNHLKDWSYCVLEVQRLSDEVAAKDHSRDYQITATAPMRTRASAPRRR